MIGQTVTVIVDRPLGSCHPEQKDLYYSVNYGHINGIIAADGEEQDAYYIALSQKKPAFCCNCAPALLY